MPEAPLEDTGHGLAPAGDGWFVVNAREARWRHRPGRGDSLPFTGWTDEECETRYPQLGVQLVVLGPGEPIDMYHWEADQEGFLVLAGEALLIVEGEERRLREWDYVHSPAGTPHMIVGAGSGPCTLLAVGSREHMAEEGWGAYVVDETALRHGAGVEEETPDAAVAYARFADTEPTRYREGWLPGDPRPAAASRPDVILDVLFEDGLFILAVANIGGAAAVDVTCAFAGPVRGLAGTVDMGELPLLRRIAFLAPGREIRTLLDDAAAYFARGEPVELEARVAWRDREGRPGEARIRHDLSIYRDVAYVPQRRASR
jgi:uncharacterized cupin superfamily protein